MPREPTTRVASGARVAGCCKLRARINCEGFFLSFLLFCLFYYHRYVISHKTKRDIPCKFPCTETLLSAQLHLIKFNSDSRDDSREDGHLESTQSYRRACKTRWTDLIFRLLAFSPLCTLLLLCTSCSSFEQVCQEELSCSK